MSFLKEKEKLKAIRNFLVSFIFMVEGNISLSYVNLYNGGEHTLLYKGVQ